MFEFTQVQPSLFLNNLEFSQGQSDNVRQATTPVEEITNHDGVSYFLAASSDFRGRMYPNTMGFAIDKTGQLTSVFTCFKGCGNRLLKSAIEKGARHLDCFDGYLKGFYEFHGFKVDRREANWVEGGPDVLYMSLNR